MARGIEAAGRRRETEDYNTKAMACLARARELIERLDPAPELLKGMDDFQRAWEDYAATGNIEKVGMRSGHGSVPHLLAPVIARYNVLLFQVWPSFVGFAQSTPVTDGERVYVTFSPGQIAAYDLTGNRVWAWREVKFQLKDRLYCDHTHSAAANGRAT